jgi:hypothetical protein
VTHPLRRPAIEEFEHAIDTLLTLLVFHRLAELPTRPDAEAQQREEGPAFKLVTANELMATPTAILRERDLVNDPIGEALKDTIHELGQAVFDQVGMDGLYEVCERVAELDQENGNFRSMLLDKAFDDVGSGNERWIA